MLHNFYYFSVIFGKILKDLGILDTIRNVFTPTKKVEVKGEHRSISFTTPYGTGVNITPDTALTFTAVWSAVRLISESVSSLPISVYTKENNGDKNEDVNSSIYKLLNLASLKRDNDSPTKKKDQFLNF